MARFLLEVDTMVVEPKVGFAPHRRLLGSPYQPPEADIATQVLADRDGWKSVCPVSGTSHEKPDIRFMARVQGDGPLWASAPLQETFELCTTQ